MKTEIVKCNTKDVIMVDDIARADGIRVVLLDEHCSPSSTYEFIGRELLGLTNLHYAANNCRIHFYGETGGELIPSMRFELVSSTNE